MDGGERLMIKKISALLCAVFMIFSVSFTSFAEEGEAFYDEDEYDNYDEFEEDFYQSVGVAEQPQQEEKPWYADLSVIPLAVGLAAGGITVLALFRRHSMARRHMPEIPQPYALDIKHTVVSDTNDNTL